VAEPIAHDRAGTCEHCGRPLEPMTMDLPLGLGARTWLAECPCAEPRRLADLRQRQFEETRTRTRQLLGESGIGVRHRDARFETFAVTAASRPIVDACRATSRRSATTGPGSPCRAAGHRQDASRRGDHARADRARATRP
jgi:hypothetical protein